MTIVPAVRFQRVEGPESFGARRFEMVRAIALGNPSSTASVVENIVVTAATSTSGRDQAPSVWL